MRAAFFVDYPQQMAGAAKSLLAAVVAARDAGACDPLFVSPSEGPVAEACREQRLEVRLLEAPSAYQQFGRRLLRISAAEQVTVFAREILPYSASLARLLDRERAEVVHFNTARGSVLAGYAAHLAGRGSALHVRGTPRFSPRYWRLAQALSHRFLLVARALEAELSPAARRRAEVVYDGVATTPLVEREEARASLVREGVVPAHVFERGVVLTSLSSVVPFKGLHHLLRAISALRGEAAATRVLLASAASDELYESWLRQQAVSLGVADRVHFLGHVRAPHLLLRASDALVLPSVEREVLEMGGQRIEVEGNEGLPHSILEAMMAALPVIATRIAGVHEEVDDDTTGLLVPPGDPVALADAIARLAADEPKRTQMGRTARDVCAERFSLESAARGLVAGLDRAKGGRLETAGHMLGMVIDALRSP